MRVIKVIKKFIRVIRGRSDIPPRCTSNSAAALCAPARVAPPPDPDPEQAQAR
jgi:hypothetical protein